MSKVYFIHSQLLHTVQAIRHGMTTRHGGVGSAPYESLNLGLHVGDADETVLENRRRACAALGFDLHDWVSGEQVHGARVARVSAEHKGRGAASYSDSIGDVDGLVTDVPGLLLAGYFADCVPLLAVDPAGPRIGIGHAGWRGTLGNIAEALVGELRAAFGTDPADLLVWIGPAIGPCCFKVHAEVAARFVDAGFGSYVQLDPHPTIDLPGVNRAALMAAGVLGKHIDVSRTCTSCNSQSLFSHRASGPKTGRMAALIGIDART